MNTIFIILIGGFLGCFANLVVKYSVKSSELKNIGNYIIALILSFAVYGIYSFLLLLGVKINLLDNLALFGLAVFLGYALDEIAHDFISLVKKEKS